MNFPKEKRMKMNLTSTSKFVSLILRHKPETIGIQLDEHGWANVDELIAGISKTREFNREILEEIVWTDNKDVYKRQEDRRPKTWEKQQDLWIMTDTMQSANLQKRELSISGNSTRLCQKKSRKYRAPDVWHAASRSARRDR